MRELTRCLESLTRLEAPAGEGEVIVVDDGSPESLHAIVTRFKGRLPVTLVVTSKAGPAVARNTGAAHARGEVLVFTDDDCEPSATWLRVLDSCFRLYPDRLVGGRTVNAIADNIYSEASQFLLDFVYHWQESKASGSLRFFAASNLAVSRLRFESLGGFSSAFPFAAAEDRDFCARWIERGWELVHEPYAQVMHSHHMSLFGFCSQHFTYGRGARTFHAARAARAAGAWKPGPWGFYDGMIQHSMRRSGSVSRKVALAMLVGLSQAANAAGYFWEAMLASGRL